MSSPTSSMPGRSLCAHAASPFEKRKPTGSLISTSSRRPASYAPRTVASYKDGVRLHFTPTFGSRQLASVTPDDFVDWHEKQRRSGAAAWSVRARWMGIRGLFGYAARTGLIVTNPCDLLVRRERPKPGKAKQRYLTAEEMKALLQRASGEGSIVVPLLLFSGLRASEALGLDWSEIDFADQVIRVRYQMSRKGERVPVKTDAGRRDVILMDELARDLRKRRLAAPFSQDELWSSAMGLATHLATPGCSEPSQTPPTPRSCGASHRTPAATLSRAS